MKKVSLLFVMLAAAFIGTTTFTSCQKEDCEECEVCVDIPTDIADYEHLIIARFKIPKEDSDVSITIGGALFSIDFMGPDGNPIEIDYDVHSFTIEGKNVTGHYKTMAAGEPVPGAEIIIEQEPACDPVGTATSDDGGKINIHLDKLGPGTYQIRVAPSITTKGGFAVGGFYAS
jgi:hypothetical protein